MTTLNPQAEKEKAAALMQKGKVSKALKIYEALVEQNDDISLWIKIGDLRHLLGHEKKAIEIYNEVVNRYTKKGLLLHGIAVVRLILKIDPFNMAAQDRLIELYVKRYGSLPRKLEEPTTRAITSEWNVVDLSEFDIDDDDVRISEEDSEFDIEVEDEDCDDQVFSLANVQVFSSLDSVSFSRLIDNSAKHHFQEGQYILKEGEPGDSIYLILNGAVQVYKGTAMKSLGRLDQGHIIGEISALTGLPRKATIIACEHAQCLEISSQQLKTLIEEFPEVEIELELLMESRLLDYLMRTSSMFVSFSKEEHTRLKSQFVGRQFKKNQEALCQGSMAREISLIVSGSARVVYTLGDEQKIITQLGVGNLFGDVSLLSKTPSKIAVIANDKLKVLCLADHQIEAVMKKHSGVTVLLAELMEARERLDEIQLDKIWSDY